METTEREELVIITPREGSEIERIREAKRVINNNLDTDIKELQAPLCKILGIEKNEAARTFIFGIICNFDTDEKLANKLTNK
jgi:hypothetical protein